MKHIALVFRVVLLTVAAAFFAACGGSFIDPGSSIEDNGMGGGAAPSGREPGSDAVFDPAFEARKAAIISRWNALKPRFEGFDYYDEQPSVIHPYAAGRLKSAFLADAVNLVNFFRFVAGLPDNVILGDSEGMYAQHAAVLLAANGVLTHSPERPANMLEDFYNKGRQGAGSSNLCSGPNLTKSLAVYMKDLGEANERSVGHRRWILSPRMLRTGFGQAGYYTAMYVFNSSAPTPDYNAICWPSGPAFPADYFEWGTVWSVSLNPNKYNQPRIQDVRVTLTDHRRGATWEFYDGCGEHFYVDNAIVFRPGESRYVDGDYYTIEVSGLSPNGNSPSTIRYDVRFFTLP